jgi:hypothetical protein
MTALEDSDMSQVVVVDADLRARLSDLNAPLELRDEKGTVLGHFTPSSRPADAADLLKSCPVSAEELERRGRVIEGRTLPEIWKRLGRTL